ncbi:hypothetical protein Glove_396g109 [Diversispora epigaea]|uniref:TLDc domain-containing protein n=1 Tax=Diversispora epigaea TaxID=1348612 RepID=A0A397H175_9GLOM|nr:hypothetical protein Glove_396g109 [Diversispora epigaea]
MAAPDRPVKSTVLPARSALVTELPPRVNELKEPFSTIISEEHAAEISSWIDRKTTIYSTTNTPYKFESILCGTRDGFSSQTFWNICHGQVGTVVIAKVKGSDEILGGYNPLAWDNSNTGGHKWMATKDSFIFSLKNGNIQNSILSRVKNTHWAILYICKESQNKWGPYFGEDLCFDNNFSSIQCYSNTRYYEKPIRTSLDFSIVNYEVFKIVRKS